MNAEHLDNDLDKALEYWRQAGELDPRFAMVHMMMAHAIFQLGDMESASEAIRKALQHDYRLTEDTRFVAKAMNYAMRNEPDKALKLYEMWVETKKLIVFVTHDVGEAVELSNRILVFARGGHLEDDIPIELEFPRDPADEAVAVTKAHVLRKFEELDLVAS